MLRDRSAHSRGFRAPIERVGALFALLALTLFLAVPAARAEAPIASVAASQLPREGQRVLDAIRSGGPFAYPRDGAPFGNRERMLPPRGRGYYTEYTVPTPGARDRGARRIVAGLGATGDVRRSGEYYYTDDHYRSFRQIVP